MITVLNNDYWLHQQAKNKPNQNAIIDSLNKYTYKEVLDLTKKTASLFREKGIKKKDHVAIISSNTIEFILIVNALWLLGAIPIPLNMRLKNKELLKLIHHSDSSFLVISETNREMIDFQKTIDYSSKALVHFDNNIDVNEFDPNNIALMMYSSGSTGSPKCVQLTFANLFESCKSADSFINHKPDDIWLSSLPFYHIGGFSIFVRSLIAGCTIALSKSSGREDLIEDINNHNPSLISLVPTMLKNLIESGIKPWKNLRILFLGGGPIDDGLFSKAIEGDWPLTTVYGSTETASMVTLGSIKNLKTNGLSAGIALEGVSINLIDEQTDAETNEIIGEVVVRSDSLARGYYNSSKEQSEKFKDGKYYTNDFGRIDKFGNLQILGRKDDIIISGGENISLREIESLVLEQDEVQDCGCVKINDKKWGQSYILFVECNNLIETNAERIKLFLEESVSKYKLPKKIFLLDQIPRSELGKLNTRALLEKFSQETL